MSTLPREWLFSIVIAVICITLAFMDLAHIPQSPSGLHARARVIAVDNSNVRQNLIVKTEAQILTVRMLTGPHKGREMTITNMLTGKLEFDEFYEVGATILVEYDAVDGTPAHGMARGHERLRMQLALIGLFALLLLLVAGVTGLKAVLSFVFAAMVLWKLYFPLILRGLPPIPTGLARRGPDHGRDHLFRRGAKPARHRHVYRLHAGRAADLWTGGMVRRCVQTPRGCPAVC